jgi:hypothetical protein
MSYKIILGFRNIHVFFLENAKIKSHQKITI